VAPAAPAAAVASLFGFVHDIGDRPIVGAEIILRDGDRDVRRVRAGSRGEFILTSVPAGTYVVWFRRLGFASMDYNWAARADGHDTVRVTLAAIPQGLSPVIVRAREDEMMRGSASLIGLVVDTLGNPVEDASVDLIGADRGGNSRANGGFLFKPLRSGPYVVRVRKIGYEPQYVTMNLETNEERELVVRMHRLPTTLDAVEILARSGYSKASEWAQSDLDRRMRWHGSNSIVLGPEDLRVFKGGGIDLVARAYGVAVLETMKQRRAANRHIDPKAISSPFSATAVEGDACVLVNGQDFERMPLSFYNVDDVELLEVYPSGTEVTGTVADRMRFPCQGWSIVAHPTWYVLWLKGRK